MALTTPPPLTIEMKKSDVATMPAMLKLVKRRISGTINPAMDCYFDRETKQLTTILWRGDKHVFSEWRDVDGTRYPAKCVGYKVATGKPWYRTEILELERLKERPADVQP